MKTKLSENIKWYQGWKNIVTLLSFLTYLPLALVVMWILASWQKRTKIVVTIVYLSFALVTYFSVNGGAQLFPKDPLLAINLARNIANYGSILMAAIVLTAIALTIFRNKLKLTIKQIWIPSAIVLLITFLTMMFSLLANVQNVYQISGQ